MSDSVNLPTSLRDSDTNTSNTDTHPNSSSPSHLLPLPATASPASPSRPLLFDLNASIIQHLGTAELAQCLRVCKEFHYHAVRRLYRTVHIGSITRPVDRLQAFDKELPGRYLPAAGFGLPEMTGSSAAMPPSPHLDASLYNPFAYRADRETLAHHLYTYTKHLIVDSHDHGDCRAYAPLVMPNLVTLRIRARETAHRYGFGDKATCGLLAELRPRKLLLGGTECHGPSDIASALLGLFGPAEPSTGVRDFPQCIQEVTIIVGEHTLPMRGDDINYIPSMPSTVQRLVLVLASCAHKWGKWRNEVEGWGGESVAHTRILLDSLPPLAQRRRLARVCIGEAKVVEIIGLETMGDILNERGFMRGQEEIKAEVRRLAVDWMGRDKAAADARVESLVFTRASER